MSMGVGEYVPGEWVGMSGVIIPAGWVLTPPPDIGCNGIWSTNGQYTSYWNTFLFLIAFVICFLPVPERLVILRLVSAVFSTRSPMSVRQQYLQDTARNVN